MRSRLKTEKTIYYICFILLFHLVSHTAVAGRQQEGVTWCAVWSIVSFWKKSSKSPLSHIIIFLSQLLFRPNSISLCSSEGSFSPYLTSFSLTTFKNTFYHNYWIIVMCCILESMNHLLHVSARHPNLSN